MTDATHLRPLSLGEILDGAFTLYRRHFGTLVLAALLPELAILALWGAYAVAGAPDAVDGAAPAVALASAVLDALTYFITPAALVWLSAQAVLGRPLRIGEAFDRVRRRFLALVGTGIVVGLAVGIGMIFLLVPGILMAIVFFAHQQAVMVEGKGVGDALSRSSDLAEGAWGRVFGVMVVFWVIALLPGLGYGLAWGMLVGDVGPVTSVGWAAEAAVESLLWVLVAPVSALGTTLLYFDRRVRVEALDLQAEPAVALDPVAVPALPPR